MRDTEDIDA